jgi:hypothetical protein
MTRGVDIRAAIAAACPLNNPRLNEVEWDAVAAELRTDVYLRWEGEYEDRYVLAVYPSLEAAQASHAGHEPEWYTTGDRVLCHWRQEAVSPVPMAITFETRRVRAVAGWAELPDRMVQTDAKWVDYPVLPAGLRVDVGTPARSCDFELERMFVQGGTP